MKKNRLLISALCVSMAVTQLPMGVFAAGSNATESVTDIIESTQIENEEAVEESIIYESDELVDENAFLADYSDIIESDNDEDDDNITRFSVSGEGYHYDYVYDYSTKILTVEGNGDYEYGWGTFRNGDDRDWLSIHRSEIEKIVFKSSGMTNAKDLFDCYPNVKEIDVSGFDTSQVTNMTHIFGNMYLEKVDVSGFDTGNVTDMSYMFSGCYALKEIDVSGFDTSKVTNMTGMFQLCESVTTLDVKGFKTSNVTDMSRMFDSCKEVSALDVSGFDTSNVTNMQCMFSQCEKVSSLDVSGFDTQNVTNIYAMFNDCASLTSIDITGFNTDNVTNMTELFERCKSLKQIDVSKLNTGKLSSLTSMFSYCTSLESIDVSSFDISNVEYVTFMFRNCVALKSLDLSNWDASNFSLSACIQGCNSLETFKTPYNIKEQFYLPVTMYDGSGKEYTEYTTPILTDKSITLYSKKPSGGNDKPDNPDKPAPEPDKPVEVQTGGTYVVKQKFNVTPEGFLGQSYAKYEVVPKGAATVKNGMVTVKKAPEDGKVTIYGLVKNGSKWVRDKAFEFTSEKPVLPKTVLFSMPYDENVNPDDDNARISVSSLVSGTSVVPDAWITAKSAIADYNADNGIIYAKSKGSTKVTVVFGDPASAECAKYPFTVKVNVPKIS